ncbi:MAG: NAD-dependent epimerase/dehydratase family protein [Planctomycetales bacterium]
MGFDCVAITGGAGFVGSSLALALRREGTSRVVAVDSLKRRGSELNLSRLHAAGVEFLHADVRCPEDLDALPEYDLLIDCSAEPSVHAGMSGSARYLLNTNLQGTINCLEAVRARGAAFLFLSTSRVYPMASLNSLPFEESDTRFRWVDQGMPRDGFSSRGIGESYSLTGARSLYGASKLAGELLVEEFVHAYGLRALINRCGVLAGPWQLGKVDQGVVALWVARHYFGVPLKYIGYGGTGKQVRDMLHVEDLYDLVARQMQRPEVWDGRIYNVGGGLETSASLLELTGLCRDVTGREVPISAVPETHAVDLRIYVTDADKVQRDFGWRPQRSVRKIVEDVQGWLIEKREELHRIFVG